MSKRPQIKQSDGSLLDLPLDAETLQGKDLSDLALKTDLDKKIDKNSGTATNLSLEGTTYIGNNAINGGGLGSIRFGTGTGFHFEDLPVNKLSFRNSESNTSYDLTVPTKSGTIALLDDLQNIGGASGSYLPLSGGTMSGDLNMDDHDIKNVSSLGVDGTITTATKLLVHDENNDIIPNSGLNYNASHYYASGIKFTTAQEQSVYNLYYPKETGTFVVKDEYNYIYDVEQINSPQFNYRIMFGNVAEEMVLVSPEACLGLSSSDMIGSDCEHFLYFPDTGSTGDDSWKSYAWNLPEKSGTIALLEDVQGGGGVSEEDVLQIIEDNSSNTSQMDVDTSISIGTSADYNPNSDTQIPTTKAVQEMINVGGGSGSGSGNYLPLSGGTMTGKINISPGGGIWAGSGGFSTIIDYPAIFTDDLSIYVTSNLEETGEGEGSWFYFPEESGTFVVKTGNNKLLNINSIEDDNEKHNRLYLAYDSDQIGISSLYNEFFFTNSKGVSEDMKHYLAYPDPSSNGVNEEYTWTLPSKSGTIALTEDIVTESRVNELISAYMTANYDNGDEGSY